MPGDLTDRATCVKVVDDAVRDLGGLDVPVNNLAPLQPATRPGDDMETFGADTPLGRAGQPAEVAPAYVFLASPSDASDVSGTVIGGTGGKPVF